MKTLRQFLLEKFPPSKYIDCPVSKEMQVLMEEYASQFAYDFSKTCECKNSPGETWCCNHCGLPVTKK